MERKPGTYSRRSMLRNTFPEYTLLVTQKKLNRNYVIQGYISVGTYNNVLGTMISNSNTLCMFFWGYLRT